MNIQTSMNMHTRENPRFAGLIMALILPGAAHVLSGYWKAGIAWYFGSCVVIRLSVYILLLPISLSFITIIAIELLAVIYSIVLLVYSYRPTRRLGCGGWIIFLLFAAIINCTANIFLQYPTDISDKINRFTGTSMYPTVQTMPSHVPDIIIITNLSNSPRRGDIVRFMYDGLPWAKRVVGLPGETIEIRCPYVLINGEKLLDPSIFSKVSSCEERYSGYIEAKDMGQKGIALPITLGPDEYFLLGDNSAHSADSRMIGPVPREAIRGKVSRIVFPPWRIREL